MTPGVKPFLFILALVDLILKGIALYKSARREQTIWFVALLLVNSLGILPIIYLVLQKDIAFVGSSKSSLKPTAKKRSSKKSSR